MKPLEEVLRNMPKPDIQPEGFRNQLRRDLLNSIEHRTSPWSDLLSVAAMTTALVFGALLVVFVAKPHIPAGLNTALLGTTPTVQERSVPQTLPANHETNWDGGFQQAGFANPVPLEKDAAYAQDWYRERYPNQGSVQLQPADQHMVSVREFITQDGRRVRVYTEIPAESTAPTQDPYKDSF